MPLLKYITVHPYYFSDQLYICGDRRCIPEVQLLHRSRDPCIGHNYITLHRVRIPFSISEKVSFIGNGWNRSFDITFCVFYIFMKHAQTILIAHNNGFIYFLF